MKFICQRFDIIQKLFIFDVFQHFQKLFIIHIARDALKGFHFLLITICTIISKIIINKKYLETQKPIINKKCFD